MPTDNLTRNYPRTTTLDFLQHCAPRVASFYHYWDSKRLGRVMPSRGDLDPVEMKEWLPRITLVDVFHDPLRLVYRLVGTKIAELRGRDVTGLTVEEAFIGASLQEVLENYRLVVEEKKPVYDFDPLPSSDGWLQEPEGLLLPLSSDASTVDKVIIYSEIMGR